jgi:hypothetical protein
MEFTISSSTHSSLPTQPQRRRAVQRAAGEYARRVGEGAAGVDARHLLLARREEEENDEHDDGAAQPLIPMATPFLVNVVMSWIPSRPPRPRTPRTSTSPGWAGWAS